MMDFTLLSKEEAERRFASYMRRAEEYAFAVLRNGLPAFILRNPDAIIVNPDKSVSWQVREIGCNLHSFLELVTGEETKKKIYLPLCLVNPLSRRMVGVLLATTVDPRDGRLNSKEAEAYILLPNGGGFKISFRLVYLPIQYIALHLFPMGFALRFKSPHCPFCREIWEEDAG